MSRSNPKVGFVSLGCPKALVDSERILTQLRAEGYEVVPTYDAADLVVVNTCGFIDDAVHESLDAIGEAVAANGRVIVTGCLGAKAGEGGGNLVQQVHPKVLAVTGPHATQEVMDAVHRHVPRPHDPFMDLVPSVGIKLTPRHYAYLKISEGCNHRCTFCIIPSMRGDLVSRPVGDVLGDARALFESGVKELLVISQDTSAYGVDVKYRTGFFDGQPVKTRLLDLCTRLAGLAAPHGAWVRLHYVYPYPHVDDVLPLMAEGRVLPYLDVPFQHAHPDVLKRMKRPASGERNLERLARWREICPELVVRSTFIAGFPGETEAEFQTLLDFVQEAQIDRAGCFAYSPVQGAAARIIKPAVYSLAISGPIHAANTCCMNTQASRAMKGSSHTSQAGRRAHHRPEPMAGSGAPTARATPAPRAMAVTCQRNTVSSKPWARCTRRRTRRCPMARSAAGRSSRASPTSHKVSATIAMLGGWALERACPGTPTRLTG